MKNETLIIRIDADLKKKLKTMAEKDNRSLSDYVHLQLKKLAEKAK
jgi:antitoxin component of RelBE/YafQ-DinJ toxin-antitoxin module